MPLVNRISTAKLSTSTCELRLKATHRASRHRHVEVTALTARVGRLQHARGNRELQRQRNRRADEQLEAGTQDEREGAVVHLCGRDATRERAPPECGKGFRYPARVAAEDRAERGRG